MTLAAVESPVPVLVLEDEAVEGNSYTVVVEFKTGSFAIDQTLANML